MPGHGCEAVANAWGTVRGRCATGDGLGWRRVQWLRPQHAWSGTAPCHAMLQRTQFGGDAPASAQ
eukprot:364003-Chlamydomonas_euryale.AAC.40